MNALVRTVYLDTVEPVAFDDLDVVRITRMVEDRDGRALPAGSSGTIVASWAKGAAYEVEFEAPFHALACVDAADLERDIAVA